MQDETLRSRLSKLMQKSRKAIRLYSGVTRNSNEAKSEYAEMQAKEWERINKELLSQLRIVLEHPGTAKLVPDVFSIRDFFYFEWRGAEANLRTKQSLLQQAGESGDFIKAALLSTELVLIKARMQAAQAVHHEISDVIKQSKIKLPAIELSQDKVVEDTVLLSNLTESRSKNKVVPLRRAKVS